jgi:four helix bundle protein
MENTKVKGFTDLVAWKEGHGLLLSIFDITSHFPRNAYALNDQMRRSAMSVTNNIAEGFSRKSKKEKIQFYFMTLGSITELQNQLIIAGDLKYIQDDTFSSITDRTVMVHKLVNGLIKSSKDYT